MDEMLVVAGAAVKALGDGKVAGYLVPFGSPEDLDLDGEFFAKDTDFDRDLPATVGTYYDHGTDPTLGPRRLGKASLEMRDEGVWLESQLDLSDRYQAAVYKLAEAGRLRLSSGAVTHLVQKQRTGKAVKITHWPLGEASFTVKPANPNATVQTMALKSWEGVPLEEAAEVKFSPEEGDGKPAVPATLAEHAQTVVSAVRGFTERVEDRVAFRVATEAKGGRVLSAANYADIQAIESELAGVEEIRGRLRALLERAQPKQPAEAEQKQEAEADTDGDHQEGARLHTEFLRRRYSELADRRQSLGV